MLDDVLCYVGLVGFAAEAARASGACRATWLLDEQLRWSLVRARYGRYRRTRLHWAAWKGKSARVAQLLTWKSNTEAADSEGVTPLILASSFTESADTVVELLRRGANIHATAATGITALHMAAICGSPLAMRELLARGAKVDSPASNERLTPLHNACQQGCVDSVRLLHRTAVS